MKNILNLQSFNFANSTFSGSYESIADWAVDKLDFCVLELDAGDQGIHLFPSVMVGCEDIKQIKGNAEYGSEFFYVIEESAYSGLFKFEGVKSLIIEPTSSCFKDRDIHGNNVLKDELREVYQMHFVAITATKGDGKMRLKAFLADDELPIDMDKARILSRKLESAKKEETTRKGRVSI